MQWRDDILFSEQQVGARLLQERRRWNRAMLTGGGGRKAGPCKHYRNDDGGRKPRRLHRYHTLKNDKSVLWGDRETYVENNSPLSTDTKLGKYKYELKPSEMITEKQRKRGEGTYTCDFRVGREWTGKCNDGTRKSESQCKKQYGEASWTNYDAKKFNTYKEIVNLLQKETRKTLTEDEKKTLNEHKENMKSGKLKFISKRPDKSDYAVGRCCYMNAYKGTVVEPEKKRKTKKKSSGAGAAAKKKKKTKSGAGAASSSSSSGAGAAAKKKKKSAENPKQSMEDFATEWLDKAAADFGDWQLQPTDIFTVDGKTPKKDVMETLLGRMNEHLNSPDSIPIMSEECEALLIKINKTDEHVKQLAKEFHKARQVFVSTKAVAV